MTNPLERLLVDEETFDLEMLSEVLAGRVSIMSRSGDIRLVGPALKLPKKHQILLYLLARKAAKHLKKLDDDGITSRDLASSVGMKVGPVSGQLTFLKQESVVELAEGRYSVPGYAVERARNAVLAASKGKAG